MPTSFTGIAAADIVLVLFLALFLTRFAVHTGLEGLNLTHALLSPPLPPAALQGHVDQTTAERSRAYTIARERLALAEGPVQAAVVLAVLLSGLLPWADARLAEAGLAGLHRSVAFMVLLGALLGLAGLPFGLIRSFGIEARFGFNRMTFGLWLRDRAKRLLLSAALGLPFLYGVFAFMTYTGEAWWLWLFGFITAVQLILLWLYPALIAPLFNRYTPLPAGELRARLEALARDAGFRTRGLYVVDASRRSAHSNAYFAGLWAPRIVLFDTLVQQLTPAEIVAVLAHEIGHFKRRHIWRRLALSLAILLGMLLVLSLLLDWPPLFAAFGFAGPSHHAALALVLLGGGAFTFWLEPLAALYSRRHEYEADAYAVALTGAAGPLKTALLRLNTENLANLYPHPWYSAYHYSHPPLPRRLAALDALAAGSRTG
jgi:STE24 endopeptidase